jgi:hypothetical protein
MLTVNKLQTICEEFANDSDTIIGMQNNWHDLMIKHIPHDFTKEEVMCALKLKTADHAIPIEVGDETVYAAFYDKLLVISTKESLLN